MKNFLKRRFWTENGGKNVKIFSTVQSSTAGFERQRDVGDLNAIGNSNSIRRGA
jgi:hypothetical protein